MMTLITRVDSADKQDDPSVQWANAVAVLPASLWPGRAIQVSYLSVFAVTRPCQLHFSLLDQFLTSHQDLIGCVLCASLCQSRVSLRLVVSHCA